jgi:hypothetical protein
MDQLTNYFSPFINYPPKTACVPDCSSKNCGSNGCAGSCGACALNQTCVNNKCIAICAPKTCAGLGDYVCGGWSDGCGKTISCGVCAIGETCNDNGQCVVSEPPSSVVILNQGSEGNDVFKKQEEADMANRRARADILQKIGAVKSLLTQLIQQLITELQKQLMVRGG